MNTDDDFLEFFYDYVNDFIAETEEKLEDIKEILENIKR